MRYSPLALLPLLLVACTDQQPTAPDIGVAPAFAVAGQSGCFTPKFHAATVYVGPGLTFEGPVTGDLIGTQRAEFTSDAFTGKVEKIHGVSEWTITGGVLGELTFITELEGRNISTDRPGSPWWLFENLGTHRALEGVEKANLTYTGTFSLLTLTGDHDFKGVICP
jgi:hypothetical protein